MENADYIKNIKNEFLSRMNHEIKTPLNAIIGMISIAKSAKDSQKKDFCLNKIEDASRHLLRVVNDILDMTKIESNDFKLSPAEFCIENMIVNIGHMISFQTGEKKQTFNINLDDSLPLIIFGDEYRLTQAILNLLSNAVKFTPNHGTITLNLLLENENKDGYTLKAEVIDTGIGIPKDQKKNMFGAFEQGDGSSVRKYGGIGLGLFLVKYIVELMEGEVWFESEPNQGAAFCFIVKMARVKSGKKAHLSNHIEKKDLQALMDEDSIKININRFKGKVVPEKEVEKNSGYLNPPTEDMNINRKDDEAKMGNDVKVENAGKGYEGIIDLAGGMKRVANNKKLYMRLLTSFKGRQMADELINSINEKNYEKVSQAAHAIKGVASNLGLDLLTEISQTIEEQAKMEVIGENSIENIDKATNETIEAINALLAEEGA